VLGGVVVEGHVVLRLAQDNLGQSREIVGLLSFCSCGIIDGHCLFHTAIVVDPEEDIVVTLEGGTDVGSESVSRRGRGQFLGEMDLTGKAEIEAETVIEGAVPGRVLCSSSVQSEIAVRREGEGPRRLVEVDREPVQRCIRQRRGQRVDHVSRRVIAVGNLDVDGLRRCDVIDELKRRIPTVYREDVIVIRKLDGSYSNPENIAHGSEEGVIEVGRYRRSGGVAETAVDIDNVFGDVVGPELEG
jgi:hypothetical protein